MAFIGPPLFSQVEDRGPGGFPDVWTQDLQILDSTGFNEVWFTFSAAIGAGGPQNYLDGLPLK